MKRPPFVALALPIAALLLGLSSSARADATDDVAAKLRTAADCTNKASAKRAWCPAGDWAKGKPHTMKPGLWIGFSVSIENDTDISVALDDDVSLVVLRVDKDGPQLSATLRDVEGAPGVDTKQVDAVAAQVRATLAGKGKVTLTKAMRAFTDSLKGRGTRAMTRGKTGWTWTTDHSAAELREVGKTFIVIETPDGGSTGRTITILTNKVK